jgi:hypothetical protein
VFFFFFFNILIIKEIQYQKKTNEKAKGREGREFVSNLILQYFSKQLQKGMMVERFKNGVGNETVIDFKREITILESNKE